MSRSRRENGSIMVLVAALVLPLMFFLFSLSVDLSAYHSQSQKAQKAADDAALFAYKFLPFASEASNAAQIYLQRFGALAAGAQITSDNHSVAIKLRSNISLHFAALFGVDLQIPIEAYSSVWSTPLDALLLLDSSAYSAPQPLVAGAWSNAADWPAANFFSTLKFFYSGGGAVVDPRVITQQCFNPALSSLKLAALRSYDYLSASEFNSVGVAFYPGNLSAIDLSRDVLRGGARGQNLGEADFIETNTSDFAADQYCAAAAELEDQHEAYKWPAFTQGISGRFSPDAGAEPMLLPPDWSFNPVYHQFLQARQVIWSRAAQSGETANFPAVLKEARSLLLGAALRGERAALVSRTRKALFIFSSDLPHLGGERFPGAHDQVQQELTQTLEGMKSDLENLRQSLTIYYVLLRHEDERPGLEHAAALFDQYLEGQQFGSSQEGLDFRFLRASDGAELSNSLLGTLLLDRRKGVVGR